MITGHHPQREEPRQKYLTTDVTSWQASHGWETGPVRTLPILRFCVSELWVVKTSQAQIWQTEASLGRNPKPFPLPSSALTGSVLRVEGKREVGIQKDLVSTYAKRGEQFNISIGKVEWSTFPRD